MRAIEWCLNSAVLIYAGTQPGPQKLEIRHERWLYPNALLHLCGGEPFTPPAAPRLGKILEWTRIRDEGTEKRVNRLPHCATFQATVRDKKTVRARTRTRPKPRY